MAQRKGSQGESAGNEPDGSGARIIPLPSRGGMRSPAGLPDDGAPSALTAAYLAEREQIYRFLLRRTGCPDTARELLHEVWLRVARLEDMPVPNRPAAYLQRIAVNLALDHIRKASFRTRWMRETDAIDRVSDDAPALERVLHGRTAVEHLGVLVQQLPAGRRRAFLLCAVEGLTAREAAGRLGVSHRTIETQYAQAVAALRKGMVEANLWP